MIKIWQFIWHGCWHDWQVYGKGKLTLGGETAGEYYAYKCSRCNRIEERV